MQEEALRQQLDADNYARTVNYLHVKQLRYQHTTVDCFKLADNVQPYVRNSSFNSEEEREEVFSSRIFSK